MLWEPSYRRNECWNIWWITPLYERFNLWGLDEWGFSTYGMLWQIMKPHIATTIELCDLYKKIWDFIARSFLRQSNFSSVHEKSFTTDQFGKWLPKYYNTLKKLMGSVIAVSIFYYWLEQQKHHWENFVIASLPSD